MVAQKTRATWDDMQTKISAIQTRVSTLYVMVVILVSDWMRLCIRKASRSVVRRPYVAMAMVVVAVAWISTTSEMILLETLVLGEWIQRLYQDVVLTKIIAFLSPLCVSYCVRCESGWMYLKGLSREFSARKLLSNFEGWRLRWIGLVGRFMEMTWRAVYLGRDTDKDTMVSESPKDGRYLRYEEGAETPFGRRHPSIMHQTHQPRMAIIDPSFDDSRNANHKSGDNFDVCDSQKWLLRHPKRQEVSTMGTPLWSPTRALDHLQFDSHGWYSESNDSGASDDYYQLIALEMEVQQTREERGEDEMESFPKVSGITVDWRRSVPVRGIGRANMVMHSRYMPVNPTIGKSTLSPSLLASELDVKEALARRQVPYTREAALELLAQIKALESAADQGGQSIYVHMDSKE
ncbi:hypothetical protein BGZ73_000827 [Actinomortierella ambigua]|nr:hypothetical protein BGZ73_000827 [Actinomortierella ambigua]